MVVFVTVNALEISAVPIFNEELAGKVELPFSMEKLTPSGRETVRTPAEADTSYLLVGPDTSLSIAIAAAIVVAVSWALIRVPEFKVTLVSKTPSPSSSATKSIVISSELASTIVPGVIVIFELFPNLSSVTILLNS